MNATLKAREEIAQGTLLATFDLLGNEVEYIPGQFVIVVLSQLIYPDDRGGRRHFSIVNSPNVKGIIQIATRIRESGFKKTLNEMQLGSLLELGPIAGRFILPETTDRPLVFIAGGIGITPFMSMLSYVKEMKLPYEITLLYSNKDTASTAFFADLESLAASIPGLRLVFSMTQDPHWQGEKSRIDAAIIKKYVPDLQRPLFYVVGPPAMNDAVNQTLLDLGVLQENIKRERFTGY
ncbi:MAG: FAD-dependent oxidoreductase [Candidatus Levybacteria bacterium]|nr:FAD-dependent oxidoreductase [Candidatus Levybacteria bacterium]